MRALLAVAAVAVAAAIGFWYGRGTPVRRPDPPPTHFQIELLNRLQVEQLVNQLTTAETARDPRRLARHEASVYAQSGEDGVLAEIFRRIGTTNRYFVEFGSGDGSENNTVLLLQGGWSGLWMDAEPGFVKTARERRQGKPLRVRQALVTAENIESLLREERTPPSFDLLAIDIDRNDYWVWKAIKAFTPRVVVIEYNAIFPPGIAWVVNYEPGAKWDGTSHFGASLTALERLGAEKGYVLVGCNLMGTNAFFVRRELAGRQFAEPFTAANHYQPARYHLVWYKSGHPRRVGPPGLFAWE
ncbi:MAG: hypothetical protein ACE15B_14845 [Bryobacteraceae bacterium]